jgi:hypothetical protein
MNNFYNYIYLDPRKSGKFTYEGLNFSLLYEPYYVGKGCRNRYIVHLMNHSLKYKNFKNSIIKKLLSSNIDKQTLKTFIMKLNVNTSNIDANINETLLITTIGRRNNNTGSLSNLCDGGDGVVGHISNKKYKKYEELYGIEKSNLIKEKIKYIGIDNGFYNKTHSEKQKQLWTNTRKGKLNNKAKKYKFISPNNVEYIVHGELIKFIKEHNLPKRQLLYHMDRYCNVGIIKDFMIIPTRGNAKILIGWIITLQ